MYNYINGIIKKTINTLNNRKKYFTYAKSEIAFRNLKKIQQCGISCTVICLLLFVLTPIAFPAWNVTLPYYLLVAASVISWLLSTLYLRKSEISFKVSTYGTACYYSVLFLLIIYIDTFENTCTEAIYFPILLIAMPIVFIIPPLSGFIMNFVFECIFLVMLYNLKSSFLFTRDLYSSVFSLVLSVILSNFVMNLRYEDNLAKFKYKVMSSMDMLTSTFNKATCTALVADCMDNRKEGELCALLILDVDHFKDINDKLGHQMGDIILQNVGRILLESFRNDDMVGRVGGDEFMVFMKNVTDKAIIEERCTEVNEKIRRIDSGNMQLKISCCIGATYIKDESATYEKCFSITDSALYEAKALGRDGYVIRDVNKILCETENI